MPKNKYRYCFVPGCSSTTFKTPEKRFINVPRNDKLRKKWLAVCKRYDGSMKSTFYCCEDHFNVDEDFDNLVQHQLTGCALRLKEGVLPSKFNCQRGRMCSYFAHKTLKSCLKSPKKIRKKSNTNEKDWNSVVNRSKSQTSSHTVSTNAERESTRNSEILHLEKNFVHDTTAPSNLMKVKEEPIDEEHAEQVQISKANSSAIVLPPENEKLKNQTPTICSSNESNNVGMQTVFQSQSSTSFLSNASSIIGIQTVRPFEIIAANIQMPVLQNHLLNFRLPSSVPASQNWPGEYGFTVSFNQQQKNSKAFSWKYSKITKKLYVKKDASCPINFSANALLPGVIFVRATAFYSSADHLSEVVRRCINHSTDDLNKGLVEAEHLVRCESRNAQYQIDPLTHRHSVVVPFENPPAGQDFSTFIYKFTCFGSCTGGPNRRPMMIVFTLEKNNEVIGRHRIDVKICACPYRDQKYEECLQTEVPNDPAKERSSELVNLSDSMEFVKNVTFPVPKKVKVLPNNEGPYTIKTNNLNCFEFLKQMRTFYEICITMKGLPPDISSALINFQQQQQQIKKENS